MAGKGKHESPSQRGKRAVKNVPAGNPNQKGYVDGGGCFGALIVFSVGLVSVLTLIVDVATRAYG